MPLTGVSETDTSLFKCSSFYIIIIIMDVLHKLMVLWFDLVLCVIDLYDLSWWLRGVRTLTLYQWLPHDHDFNKHKDVIMKEDWNESQSKYLWGSE